MDGKRSGARNKLLHRSPGDYLPGIVGIAGDVPPKRKQFFGKAVSQWASRTAFTIAMYTFEYMRSLRSKTVETEADAVVFRPKSGVEGCRKTRMYASWPRRLKPEGLVR